MRIRRINSTHATEVTVGDNTVLVSYSTPVAALVPGHGYCRTEAHHSRTTTKHINSWLDACDAIGCDTKPQSFFDALMS
jgi:hypothetical protein